MTDNEVGDWGPEHVEELVRLWEDLLQEVRKHQVDYYAVIVRNYLNQENLSHYNIRFLFTAGEPVLVQARTAAKLTMWSKGPFHFVHYVSLAQVRAEIETSGGSQHLLSFILLKLMQAEYSPQLACYPPQAPNLGLTPSHSLQDLTITSSYKELEEPPPGPAMGETERPAIAALGKFPGATMDSLLLKYNLGEVVYSLPTLL